MDNMLSNDEIFYTIKDIAEKLHVEERTIRNYIYSKKLEAVKIGKTWKVKKIDYNLFIEGQKRRETLFKTGIIEGSDIKEIYAMGINLHSLFFFKHETLIRHIKSGATIKCLILDPSSESFQEIEKLEEMHNKKMSGRLKAELLGTIATYLDILNFTENESGSIHLKFYDIYFDYSSTLTNPNDNNSKCQIKFYPRKKNVRCIDAEKEIIERVGRKNKELNIYRDEFDKIWNNEDKKFNESREIPLDKYIKIIELIQ